MEGAAKMGLDFRIVSPKRLFPEDSLVASAGRFAAKSGARITVTDDIDKGVHGAQVIYTDVWVSMGEETKEAERIDLLRSYAVDMTMLQATGIADVKFMHCLPAFHDRDTSTGEEVFQKYGLEYMEVSDEVFRSPHSIVFDQAENRMHTIKAVIALTI